MVDNKEERGSERDEKLDRKVPTLCTDFVCGCVYVCAYTSTNLVYAMTVDTGDTQAAPEKVAAQSRWARLRVKHVDEVVAKKRTDLMKGFTEFQEHMRDWPAFVAKVRTRTGGVFALRVLRSFIHLFIHFVQ